MLVLLGMLNEQDTDQADQGIAADSLEQSFVQSALLPLDPFHAASFLSACLDPPEGFLKYMRLSQETHRSRLLKNELQVAQRISGEISPDLLHMTGHFIYCHSKAEIPS
jgi:hypothetical protein